MTALLAAIGAALAGTLIVLPPGVEPARRPALDEALDALGYAEAAVVSAEVVGERIALATVHGLPSEEECGAPVPMDAWHERFDLARSGLQLLAFAEAMDQLVALDADLPCLATPPAAADLFRLELAIAEAETFLGQTAADDPETWAFHAREAHDALVRAAAFGATLSLPAGVAPEVVEAYDRVRSRGRAPAPVVAVVGPGARHGARFNGRPITDGAFDAVAGANLVQAADGAAVTAAARLRLVSGRTLVWLAPEGEDPLAADLPGALASLASRGGPRGDAEVLLAGVARLLGEEVLFLRDEGDRVSLLGLSGVDRLGVRAEAAVRPPPVERWRLAVGAGPAIGWTDLGGGPLEGLGGTHAGFAIEARVAATPLVSVAASFAPWAVAAPVPSAQGGGTLFRATLPATIGVRIGARVRRLAPEVGADVGVHSFGDFGDAGHPDPRASFLARVTVGAAGAIAPAAALRVAAWAGGGLGYLDAGGYVGVEGRR